MHLKEFLISLNDRNLLNVFDPEITHFLCPFNPSAAHLVITLSIVPAESLPESFCLNVRKNHQIFGSSGSLYFGEW